MTEWSFHITTGCQMRYGLPRSMIKEQMNAEYPRNAVRIMGRSTGRYLRRLKICTTAASVKPPPANATENSLKPTQSPQGNSSLRFVDAPRPRTKRKIREYAPASNSTQSTPLQKPIRGLVIFVLRLLLSRKPSGLFAFFGRRHLRSSIGNPPDPAQ